MSDLRAKQARDRFLEAAGETEESWNYGDRLLDLFTALVMVRGTACTADDVAGAWAIAETRIDPPFRLPLATLTPRSAAFFKEHYRKAIQAAGADMARPVPFPGSQGDPDGAP